MKKFKVRIFETYAITITVNVENKEDAENIVCGICFESTPDNYLENSFEIDSVEEITNDK